MNSMQPVDTAMIDRLLADAARAPRRRKNLNFHRQLDDPCQRLLNAILPGSYVRPHRHIAEHKDEFMIVVTGCLGIIFYNEHGAMTSTLKLEVGGAVHAVNIPAGQYHAVVALKPTVIFETKAGPYAPLLPEELAPFAPAEESPQALQYQRRMEAVFAHP